MPDLIRGRQCLPLCKGRWHGALRRDGGVADTKPAQKSTYQSLSQPIGCQLPLHKGAKGCGTDTTPHDHQSRKEVFHMTDQTRMPDRTLSEFTAQLASASARAGRRGRGRARGGAGGEFSRDGRERDGREPPLCRAARTRSRRWPPACDAQRTALLALIDADAAGFLPLQRAYAIPKDRPRRARPGSRSRRVRRAWPRWPCWRTASRWRCCCPPLSSTASPLLRSDVGCAAALVQRGGGGGGT